MPPTRATIEVRPIYLGRRPQMLSAVLTAIALVGLARAQRGDPEGFSRDGGFTAPKVIFFPPNPPPLDRPINHVAPPAPRRLLAPPELAAYVNELFYAPLSTWLAEESLTEKLRQRLNAYRAQKLTLQHELQTILEQTRSSDPAARLLALEVLSRQQAARLTALEQAAEQLREDLAVGGNDWRALRDWSLGGKHQRGDSPLEISSVMRAYAFYERHLTAPQRRLLREISMELAVAGDSTTAAQANQPFMFFPPEPDRVLLPDDLPSDLAAKVATYQTKKSSIKKELFDTVVQQDGATFAFARHNAIKALAEKQASRLAELDQLAEEIRRGLVHLPAAGQRPAERSPLPPVLTARIGALLQTRTALQKETSARIEAIRAHYASAPVQISYGYENDGLKFIVIPRRTFGGGSPGDAKEQARAIEAEVAAVAENYGRRFADLVNETNAIREETSKILGQTTPTAVENAIGAATRVAALRDSEEGYRDYRTAVFEPGLSPGQRRLLFDGAVLKLDLPLSRGEFQPMRRAPSW